MANCFDGRTEATYLWI